MQEKTQTRIEHLIQHFPQAANDNRLLLLLYWKVYDGIEIPSELIKQIIHEGSMPETVTRGKRLYRQRQREKVVAERQMNNSTRY